MKIQQLLEMSGYKVIRHYRGSFGFPEKKRYYYLLEMKNGDTYRIRKYDVKNFIERGATYEERGVDN
jgi:hypothetical protein